MPWGGGGVSNKHCLLTFCITAVDFEHFVVVSKDATKNSVKKHFSS